MHEQAISRYAMKPCGASDHSANHAAYGTVSRPLRLTFGSSHEVHDLHREMLHRLAVHSMNMQIAKLSDEERLSRFPTKT